jgi:uncharacterized DUF497 family protein
MQFEWDDIKAASNFKKHGVTFDEAVTVFSDPLACIFDDEWNSIGENREIIVGYSTQRRILMIVFTERLHDVIRIISARTATTTEVKKHEDATKF